MGLGMEELLPLHLLEEERLQIYKSLWNVLMAGAYRRYFHVQKICEGYSQNESSNCYILIQHVQ